MQGQTDTHLTGDTQPAREANMAPWGTGELPQPPGGGWRLWVGLLGPGVVMAGTAVGTGEWLLGPAMTAQYGGALLWLATISIMLQVFCNLVVMRYALFCGEPLLVGAMRVRPGPRFFIACLILLDFSAIWPYNAQNAAVPLVAAILGHLPATPEEFRFVKFMGFVIYFLAFVPLIFGGTIYRMLEKIMAAKLVYVLGYLTIVAVFFVSAPVAWEAISGFFRFGAVPLRAETVVDGQHFTLTRQIGSDRFVIRGTGQEVLTFTVNGAAVKPPATDEARAAHAAPILEAYDAMVAESRQLAGPGKFFVERNDDGLILAARGSVGEHHSWQPAELTVTDASGARQYSRLEDVPQPYRGRLENIVQHKGSEVVGIVGYVGDKGRLPPLDWAILAAFCAYAGAGALTNAMLANYTRDKGWGMGKLVGAIPSAVAGRTIELSPAGKVFPMDAGNMGRWRGWVRHITRDQVLIWGLASFLGMLLPCMMSLEFIRNATVHGDRVAAMTAEGISSRFPEFSGLFWTLTLLCGFMILAPGQVSIGDQISRRWTDILWSASPRARRWSGGKVKKIYYTILGIFCLWGIVPLAMFDPLTTAKISGALANLGLAFTAALAVYVNRSLMPRELRPAWYVQAGSLLCSAFYLGITGILVWSMLK